MELVESEPDNLMALTSLSQLLDVVSPLSLDLTIWEAQNICYECTQTLYPQKLKDAENGDENAIKWIDEFKKTANLLGVGV